MLSGLSRRFRRRARLHGLVAAFAALVGQIAIGAVVAPGGGDPLAAAVIFCHAPAGADDSGTPSPQHPADAALCPLAVALAQPALTPAPEIALPPPRGVLAHRPITLPPVRAPPGALVVAAYPRGPPALS